MFPLFSGALWSVWGLGLAGYPLGAPGESERDEERGKPSAPVHHFLRIARPSGRISNQEWASIKLGRCLYVFHAEPEEHRSSSSG
jgi:hypothetical protein